MIVHMWHKHGQVEGKCPRCAKPIKTPDRVTTREHLHEHIRREHPGEGSLYWIGP